METRSNFGSQKFLTTSIRNDNEDSYASINLPLTLSSLLRAQILLRPVLLRSAKMNQMCLVRGESLGAQAEERGGPRQHHPRRRRAGAGSCIDQQGYSSPEDRNRSPKRERREASSPLSKNL